MSLVAALSLFSAPALAKAPKTYQVTGPVVSADKDLIVVKKGKETWEIARGKVDKPEIKEGDQVTLYYTMTADSLEVKPAKGGTVEKSKKADADAKKADTSK